MEQRKQNERNTLHYVTGKLVERLTDLIGIKPDDEDCFAYGEKTAYVECLEWIQMAWEEGKENGLDFDIEKRYPL